MLTRGSVVLEELLNLHRGQGMDLYWRDLLTAPTEQEYLDMVSNSTYSLYMFLCNSATFSFRV